MRFSVTIRRDRWPCVRASSVVISRHQWSSVVISGNPTYLRMAVRTIAA